MDRSVLPFYFPTNIILLDDDTSFLRHFSLLLDSTLPCRLYNSASTALNAINNQNSITSSFAEFTNITLLDEMEERIYLDLNKLHNLVFNQDRFSQISVVIIDYDMPEMNGLEVCRQIQHSEIKKILLTGKADEKIAVEAFNAGLIHQYIQKSLPEVDVQLNKAIAKLQHEYFREITKSIQIALTDKAISFQSDLQFIELFSKLINEKKCVEFYLWENPKGIMLLDAKGNTGFLFVMSDEVMRTHYEIAQACEAPADLLELIKGRNHVPWFPTADGYYTKSCLADWRDYVYQANFTCANSEQDLCSLVYPAPLTTLAASGIRPFQSYLDSFDAMFTGAT